MHRTCSLRVLSRSVSGTEIEYTHVITVFPLLWNFTCFAVWKIVYPTLYLGYYDWVFPHEVALRGELSTRLIKGACSWNFHLRVTSLPVLWNFSIFLHWFFRCYWISRTPRIFYFPLQVQGKNPCSTRAKNAKNAKIRAIFVTREAALAL